MAFSVELSRRAETDIEDAFSHIAADSPQNAMEWRYRLYEKLSSLASFPSRCGVAPENYYSSVEIRQTFLGNYRVLFTIREDKVFVVTIRHGARKFLPKSELDSLT